LSNNSRARNVLAVSTCVDRDIFFLRESIGGANHQRSWVNHHDQVRVNSIQRTVELGDSQIDRSNIGDDVFILNGDETFAGSILVGESNKLRCTKLVQKSEPGAGARRIDLTDLVWSWSITTHGIHNVDDNCLRKLIDAVSNAELGVHHHHLLRQDIHAVGDNDVGHKLWARVEVAAFHQAVRVIFATWCSRVLEAQLGWLRHHALWKFFTFKQLAILSGKLTFLNDAPDLEIDLANGSRRL
jgi:hypothetical protein